MLILLCKQNKTKFSLQTERRNVKILHLVVCVCGGGGGGGGGGACSQLVMRVLLSPLVHIKLTVLIILLEKCERSSSYVLCQKKKKESVLAYSTHKDVISHKPMTSLLLNNWAQISCSYVKTKWQSCIPWTGLVLWKVF